VEFFPDCVGLTVVKGCGVAVSIGIGATTEPEGFWGWEREERAENGEGKAREERAIRDGCLRPALC
jgi:hypothetical protein